MGRPVRGSIGRVQLELVVDPTGDVADGRGGPGGEVVVAVRAAPRDGVRSGTSSGRDGGRLRRRCVLVR